MKTTIQTFCEAFSRELEPFGEDLGRALAALPQREGVEAIDRPRIGLQEVQQRLSTLREKISGQRTFLLIFGPLKSGKSTLMNALSGAYVSEVSSLPAYPALVYVKHGEQRRFEATDYEGERREFRDNIALADAVQADHARLADAIVAAENRGEIFEPQRHHPRAIRRMDIEVPAAHLAESGSVLVDTPGLYTRMKFGYDQMTQDFRDTAACAIFVVKTDNLFFEKVFEEFEALLSNFSRIFLISNVDSTKQDLRPDGSLEASLESREPEKIIEAFRSLSMSATLRGAIEDGRLRIYPIDLLRAASRTLRGGAAEEGRDDGFDSFVADLTGYLNSSDYLHDFMFDSVRLAQDLTAETGVLVSGDAAAALGADNRRAREELEREREQLVAVEALAGQDWDSAFDALRQRKDGLLGELVQQNTAQLESTCQEQLSAWMDSDESWRDLVEKRLGPELEREMAHQAEMLRERLRSRVEEDHAGAAFSEAQLASFREAGLQVDEALAAAMEDFGTGVSAGTLKLELEVSDIPVAHTLGDWVLLRSRGRIRQDMFGEDGSRGVAAALKQRRFGRAGLEKIRQTVRDTVRSEMPALQRRYATELVEAHVKRAAAALREAVEASSARLQERVAAMESTLRLREQAQAVFRDIESSSLRFGEQLGRLRQKFDLA